MREPGCTYTCDTSRCVRGVPVLCDHSFLFADLSFWLDHFSRLAQAAHARCLVRQRCLPVEAGGSRAAVLRQLSLCGRLWQRPWQRPCPPPWLLEQLLATSCDCLRLLAAACDCLWLLATACGCLRLLAAACDSFRLLSTSFDFLRAATYCGFAPPCVCTVDAVCPSVKAPAAASYRPTALRSETASTQGALHCGGGALSGRSSPSHACASAARIGNLFVNLSQPSELPLEA